MAAPDEVVARPPRLPVRFLALVAALTVPLAVLAVAVGDVLLGLIALVSAGWAGWLAYVGATAVARADTAGVSVTWMRHTEVATWDEVVEVHVDRAGPGGPRRGALLFLGDGRRLRWTPWIPLLWFAHRAAVLSLHELDDLLRGLDRGLRVLDPDAPETESSTWTRPMRSERQFPRSAKSADD